MGSRPWGDLYPGSTHGGRYYRARYYHPQLHRFIREDPIGFFGGDVNLYAYVGNRPVSGRDPLGLYTEMIFWEAVRPSLSNWGSSSFGHVSANVNGTSFSFAPGGWDRRPDAREYIAAQHFRGGTGVILNLTEAQEAAFMNCLKSYADPYNPVGRNCVSPHQSCLNQIGLMSAGPRTFPGDFYVDLVNAGLIRGFTQYPATSPDYRPIPPLPLAP